MTVSGEGIPEIVVLTDSNILLVEGLLDESISEGFLFIQKTLEEWNDGSNRFSKPGEQLWGLLLNDKVIGIGGLNQDQYSNNYGVGRVRHLYISKAHRRRKCVSTLVDHIKNAARPSFSKLTLFTENPDASLFYKNSGFTSVEGYKVTHELIFGSFHCTDVIDHRMQ